MAVDRNPMGLDGFEFVEFTSPDGAGMAGMLEQLGFTAYAAHPTKAITLYRQGRINLLVNLEAEGQAADFRAIHGASANGMAFRVKDASAAYDRAIALGARAADPARSAFPGARVVEGIGGALLYLIEAQGGEASIYDDWRPMPDAAAAEARNSIGLELLDHLTHNVERGRMRHWSAFYRRIFNFREQKHFDIRGQATGLFSQAMIAPDGAIRIPLNESQDDKSQIEEFLKEYNGEGIQHLAFSTDDIYGAVERLRARGVRLQDTVETYYELVDQRVPGHGEDLERLRRNRILIDGNVGDEGVLLQIFTENLFGPIFFEIIQRKGNQGFGNGNFQALFESIELDQIRRGVVEPGAAS